MELPAGATMQAAARKNKKILVLSSQAFSLLHFRLDMMRAFVALGYQVYAAAPDKEAVWTDVLGQAGIRYYSFEMQRTGENPLEDIYGFFSLRRLLKTIRPDILFAYQAKTVIYGTLAAHSLKMKDIYALIAGLGSAFRNDQNTLKQKLVCKILCVEYKAALKRAKTVFFQNHDDSAEFIKKGLVDRAKIRYMQGSGVNMEHFAFSELPDRIRFLFVGRLIRDKGIMEYLQAAQMVKKEFPQAEFEVIGYYDSNPTSVQEKDIGHYFDSGTAAYLGKKDDVKPWLDRCYAFVLPSYHEGTPKSVLEAMAVGRPIITSDAPGCRETVKEGENGFLVPVGDSRGIAAAMKKLIQRRDLAATMGRRSHQMAAEKYDVNLVNQRLAQDMSLC